MKRKNFAFSAEQKKKLSTILLRAFIGPFRGGNKPPVLPGEEKGFSKAKNGELKAAEVVAKN